MGLHQGLVPDFWNKNRLQIGPGCVHDVASEVQIVAWNIGLNAVTFCEKSLVREFYFVDFVKIYPVFKAEKRSLEDVWELF